VSNESVITLFCRPAINEGKADQAIGGVKNAAEKVLDKPRASSGAASCAEDAELDAWWFAA
jgi:hypothetical protein